MAVESKPSVFLPKELPSTYGELERFLIKNPEETRRYPTLLSYEDLPDQITSGRIDLYANWLAYITIADAKRREVGGETALVDNPRRLVFQPNPTVGDESSVCVVRFNPKGKIMQAAETHTHPDLSPFGEVDIRRIACIQQVMDKMLGRKATYEEYMKIVSILDFFKDEYHYRKKFELLLGMSDRHKWGVYFSNKDGIFRRLHPSNVERHMEENIARAIDEVFSL